MSRRGMPRQPMRHAQEQGPKQLATSRITSNTHTQGRPKTAQNSSRQPRTGPRQANATPLLPNTAACMSWADPRRAPACPRQNRRQAQDHAESLLTFELTRASRELVNLMHACSGGSSSNKVFQHAKSSFEQSIKTTCVLVGVCCSKQREVERVVLCVTWLAEQSSSSNKEFQHATSSLEQRIKQHAC